MEVKQISREVVFQGKKYSMEHLKVQYPNGKEATYEVLGHPGAVAMVPVDDEGQAWFVRQYRAAINAKILELPAGTLEAGEDPAICAGRELREEIGMAAEDIKLLGAFYLAPGYSAEYMYIYLATGLRPDELEPDEDEFLEVERIPLEDVYHMLISGEFKDAKTVAGLALARPHIAT